MHFADRYEKLKLLGEGAFGAAYLVRSKDERTLQVVKEIRISHLTEKQREGALAESGVLRMLKHVNIIAYVSSFFEGPRLYIVMEYADGGDLAGKIKERKDLTSSFEEWEIMRIFVQLVLALIYIHSRKVLHRDLKPLNVFLTLKGVVKLGDFGIARILDSSTAGAHTTIGTPHYLSPEMVNNEAYGTKSDLWSLGVVTYELAALRVPFRGNSLPAVAMQIMGAEPDPLDRSTELNWIVMGLLSKDPSQRPRLEAIQRLPFVQKYIQDLLYYSMETGSGGCEALTLEPLKTEAPKAMPSRRHDGERDRRDRREAAQAEFVRTRQAALEAKRRAEAANVSKEERGPRVELERPRRPYQEPLSGKEREAEVRRRARAERDEQDALHWDALSKAMREHQEECRRLELRLKSAEQVEQAEQVARVETEENEGNEGHEGQPRATKKAEEAEYLERLAEARKEQAQERRRLADRIAMRRMADDEVSVGSGEEVDSDKENAGRRQMGDGGESSLLLEIPFTDKVKPKPKLSSDGRKPRAEKVEPRRGSKPPAKPSQSAARSIRAELGLRSSSRGKASRASGTPAQWLRAGSCERSSVMEKLPPAERRPSLDMAYSSGPAPTAPPTPQGDGDVSQLQDALAYALCGVEGVREVIPEEILAEEGVATDVEDVGQMTLVSDWKDTYD